MPWADRLSVVWAIHGGCGDHFGANRRAVPVSPGSSDALAATEGGPQSFTIVNLDTNREP